MKVHQLEQTQILPIPLEEAWAFFCDSNNLDNMTPPDLGFRTISGDDELMFQGQIICHKVQIAPPLWTNWTTEITTVVEGDLSWFIDEQRSGPYRFWHHLHRFEACDSGTKMLDRVHYALPFYPFGEIGIPFVKKKLELIFGFRRKYLEERFGRVEQQDDSATKVT